MLRNEKGITLVALVITIVILIILATVAISFAFDKKNGLVSRAEDAAKYQENADKQFNEFSGKTEQYIDKVLENAGITK